jgi:predicted RNase H-like nuclease
VADAFARAAMGRGYHLADATVPPGTPDVFLESYPHPALLGLLDAPTRVPYKVSRSSRYWPGASREERIRRLEAIHRRIVAALAGRIAAVPAIVPREPATLAALARVEHVIDALVCAWVGAEYLAGRARALGDADNAIWAPESAFAAVGAGPPGPPGR